MQQDLEEEKNKTVIQDLAEKVENHEANLKKKDFAIQNFEITVKEHEGRGIPTSVTPVSGRLALPPSCSPSRSTHLGWDTRRHSLVGPRDPPVSKRRQC